MTIAMQIIQIVFQSVAILFMLTFMFIGIWSFIIFIKIYKNQKEKNYLLEKVANNIISLLRKSDKPPTEE
jgi:hypothetical protein